MAKANLIHVINLTLIMLCYIMQARHSYDVGDFVRGLGKYLLKVATGKVEHSRYRHGLRQAWKIWEKLIEPIGFIF